MKKFLFFVFFVLTAITNVFSDTKAVYKDTYLDEWGEGDNVVEITAMYPGALLGLRYERKIENNLSLAALFFYNVAGDVSSIGARLEGNFYVHNHSLNAFFMGPFLSLYNLNGSDKNGLFFGSGINLGYRWIFNDFYSLTPGITFQYGIGPESDKNIRAGASGFSYGAGVSGGIIF